MGLFQRCSNGGHLQGGVLEDPVHVHFMLPLGRPPEGLRPWQVGPGPALSRVQEPYHALDGDSPGMKPTSVSFPLLRSFDHTPWCAFAYPPPITVLLCIRSAVPVG